MGRGLRVGSGLRRRRLDAAGCGGCPDRTGEARDHAHAASLAATLEGGQPGRDARSAVRGAGGAHRRARCRHDRPAARPARSSICRCERSSSTRASTSSGPSGRAGRSTTAATITTSAGAPTSTEVGQPVQERVPIWVVGVWPRPKSMRRVLRCDGVVPQIEIPGRAGSPDDIRDIRAWLAERGRDGDRRGHRR